MCGGGQRGEFAANSPNESIREGGGGCLGFLVYLFCGAKYLLFDDFGLRPLVRLSPEPVFGMNFNDDDISPFLPS